MHHGQEDARRRMDGAGRRGSGREGEEAMPKTSKQMALGSGLLPAAAVLPPSC